MPANILALALLVAVFAGIVYVGLGMPTTRTQDEPAEPVVPATEQCAVQDCPREWQNGRHGTQLCHTHYRELVTHRRAS